MSFRNPFYNSPKQSTPSSFSHSLNSSQIDEAQLSLAAAQEKERMASEQLMEASTRLTTLDSQLQALRHDKAKLQAQVELQSTKVQLIP